MRDTSERYYSRLPGVGKPGPWLTEAACRDKPGNWFFPLRDSHPGSYTKGKKVCASCPVCGECREDAVKRKEVAGLWGGLAPWELQALIRVRQKRGA